MTRNHIWTSLHMNPNSQSQETKEPAETPGGRRELPYVGRYHLSVNRPPLSRKSCTQWPRFSLQSTSTFSKCWSKIQNFSRALHAFWKLLSISTTNSKFSLKFNKIYTEWPPILGSSHQKGPFFFLDPTPNDPLFSMISYTEWPLFSFYCRHIPVTFKLECFTPFN